MKNQIVESDYQGLLVHFTNDAWFNATEAAEHFGKRVDNWLRLAETEEYIRVLFEVLNPSDVRDLNTGLDRISNTRNSGYSKTLLQTKRGKKGGTWLHPSLAVVFARWLNKRFAVWCDLQIYNIIRRQHPEQDRRRLRHESASTNKVRNSVLQLTRKEEGKETAPHHYMNASLLVNWVLTGEFKSLDRDVLSLDQLDAVAKLETRDAVLLGMNASYGARKIMLAQFYEDWKASHVPVLTHEAPAALQ